MRKLLAIFKILVFLVVCLLTFISQGTMYLFFRNSKGFYTAPRLFHKYTCLIFGVKVKIAGTPEEQKDVVFVGNHLSYIDIPAIGQSLSACFISKADVKSWPIFGPLASISDTIFIERTRSAAVKCIADIKDSLLRGRPLILFPEGTSSSGRQVLPFKSSIFDLFLKEELKEKLVVQPFTVTLTKTNGKDVETQEDFDLYAWHGDMEFGPHFWQLAQTKGAELLVTFHPSLAAKDYDSRKKYAQDCERAVSEGLKNTLPSALDFKS